MIASISIGELVAAGEVALIMVIGELLEHKTIEKTKNCKTPLAVSGRVLAYPYEPKETYNPGDAVCSGPNGTISKMTRAEIRDYPERIVGTVSEIPTYEVWGSGNVKVNGRIWIKVR